MSELEEWKRRRWDAFRSNRGGEVFGSIAGAQDVWGRDPYDEETIHGEARQVFSDLIEVAADRQRGGGRGRMFLLLGDAGSGKTHLMGAYRRMVEDAHAGCFAYAQMTTSAPDLTKYLLRNVIESLQRTGAPGRGNQWLQLSDGLVERPSIPAVERDALRNSEDYAEPLRNIRHRLNEDLHSSEGEGSEPLHEDFLTALLVLQRRDGNATAAAMKYLRGDPLSAENLQWLCSPQGLSGAGEPAVLLKWLIGAVRDWGGTRGGAFVLCIDQLEEAYIPSAPEQGRFPDLLTILRSFADNQAGFIVVLACLQDYYTGMRALLTDPFLARLERDTKPVHLSNRRTQEEIIALVGKRLALLDAEAGIDRIDGADELFPFTRHELKKLQGLRPRAVLAACRDGWLSGRRSEEPRLIEILIDGDPPYQIETAVEWGLKWNDSRSTWNVDLPKRSDEYAEMLAKGVNALGQQTQLNLHADAASDLVRLTLVGERAVAGICDGAAQGGRLSKQIQSLRRKATAEGQPGIVVRSTEFAKSPKAKVYTDFGELVKVGGRRVTFPESDWRTLQAWLSFEGEHCANSGFVAWKQSAPPLADVAGLRDLVRLEDLLTSSPPKEPVVTLEEDGAEEETPLEQPDTLTGEKTSPVDHLEITRFVIGASVGFRPEPVIFETPWFTQHVAVLGGTGSGKTTLAMILIEHLLIRGVPAILVDRKGDLARYADAAALKLLPGELGALFRERIDVALYTPGSAEGRSLALSVLPARNLKATTEDTAIQAEDAAQALAAMLGYGESRAHTKRRAALIAAIQVLLSIDNVPPTLDRLLDLMNSGDPALLQAMDYLDPKLLREIVQDLDSFRKINSRLLGAGAEPLDAARLFGMGEHALPGRTRLSVISTKSLGANEVVQFWVAQLMMELARFASTRPSNKLQAVVMLDEADLYLPAVGKPASKQPVENALRRFRSQGIGLMLATQSPGDFDYRCRENIQTWLVGRVKETRALEKLRPVFGQENAGALEKLGQHATGEFCLVRPGSLTKFQADRNLLPTEQMSDTEILAAARNSRKS